MNVTAHSSPRPRRVVVIDDTEDLRQLLGLALTRGGFEIVAEAADGEAGIEVVREHRPDVVLLDLAMPVMDGIEALPAIRRLVPAAKVIVLSGFGAQQMSARAVAKGADGYVQKGAPLSSILDYVRSVCEAPASRNARALSVVPSADPAGDALPADRLDEVHGDSPTSADGPLLLETTPAPAGLASPEEALTASSPPGRAAHGSTWEALSMAPFGVVELADEPLFRVVSTNAVGQRLLGTTRPGSPLAMSAPELASLVSYHRLDADASFEVDLEGGRCRATLRRTGWSVLVYLDSTQEDVGVLRRAIATTAREIRGPVAVLNGIAETITAEARRSTDLGPGEREILMASIARQTRILDGITADLLTAAQIQRGTLRVDMAETDLGEIVHRVAAEHDGVRVVVDDDRTVRADGVRLAQVLSNLLANAHQHGAAPVTVHVSGADDQVTLEVSDAGKGVPVDFEERLFTEYARATDTIGGSGLGLYIVRSLTQAMSGDVSYRRRDDDGGGGAVFTVHLLAATHGDVSLDAPAAAVEA